ncbi:hypothetical protein KJ603_02420 [Patescibacteria group bacterium]|nr:hypothetical protein [Patescibacteria group bacterium]
MLRKFRSEEIAKKHKRIFWAKFILFWILLFTLAFLFSYLLKLEKINISNININGNKVILEEDVLEIVNKNLEGDYLRVFPKSNIFIYPKSKIKKELSDSFLRIKELIITFKDLQSIDINIVERTPFALYCENKDINLATGLPSEELGQNDGIFETNNKIDNEIASSTDLGIGFPSDLDFVDLGREKGEECYFMDSEGYIYAKAMSFTDDVYFKYEIESSQINNLGVSPISDDEILGKIYLSESVEGQFEKVNLFIRFLKDINVDIYKLMVKENGDYQLSFDNDSLLIFDEKQDFDLLLENLQAVLIDLGDLEDRKFEYIDLRFSNKVLYKFKEK